MTFSILTTPSAAIYLQSFRADPRLGQMLVPMVNPDSNSPDGYTISQQALSDENCSAFLNTASAVLEEVERFRTGSLLSTVPHTGGAWEALQSPMLRGARFLNESAYISIGLRPDDTHLTVGPTSGVSLQMSVPFASDRGRAVVCLPSYSIELEGELTMGLRTFLGLPSTARIDHVVLALRQFLGLPGDPVTDFDPHREYLEEDEGSTYQETIDLFLGREFYLLGGFDPAELGEGQFHEQIKLSISAESSHTAPLPEEALRLWDWMAGLRTIDGDEEAYHRFTARLYAKNLPET